MHAELLKLFHSVVPLSKEETELIKACFKPFSLGKGEYFLKAGEVCKHLGFIKHGLVRYYVYKNEEEATFEFTREGEFIADYQSFSKNTVTLQNIQAIEDCELLIIDFKDVQSIFNNTKNGNLLGRLIIEHRFDVMVNQLLSIYMHSQEERYVRFIKHYSDLTQRIPLYLIASYVGVKPQSLSRIRKRYVKGIS